MGGKGRERAHQPESDGRELAVGIRYIFYQGNERLKESLHDHSGENQSQRRVAARPDSGTDGAGEQYGQKAKTKARNLYRGVPAIEHQTQRRAETGPCGRPKNVRRHHRVSKGRLIHTAGKGD